MKLKTRKTISKRFKIKKRSGKVIMRTCGQSHFNSRESGKVTKGKRRDKTISKTTHKIIKASIQ
ncbi:50S ribosomal protein L35 [Patescibacteria group bacterium]|nr:50S ribosomal protein L35 [Patescibacteria group bacterium]MBU4512937.1 50S ribosomal protein L35 [Patescibacteria group bacterium]